MAEEQAPKKPVTKAKATKLLVVRVRGNVRLSNEVKDTLAMMRLYKTNYCVVLDNTPSTLGMIKKAKDYITWGDAREDVVEDLFAKKGEAYKGPETDSKKKISYKGRFVEFKGKKYKKFFKLQPPQKGYGREGIKMPWKKGGALGNRGEKINDLVKRMI